MVVVLRGSLLTSFHVGIQVDGINRRKEGFLWVSRRAW